MQELEEDLETTETKFNMAMQKYEKVEIVLQKLQGNYQKLSFMTHSMALQQARFRIILRDVGFESGNSAGSTFFRANAFPLAVTIS